jgi:hypothetical protein
MVPSLHTLLVGPARSRPRVELPALVAVVGVAVFAAYAAGVVAVSGGVVLVAWHAAVAGVAVGATLAWTGRGLLFAWLAAYAALLGQAADHYLLGLPGRPLAGRVAALVEPDGLVALAVIALVVGSLAWVAGTLARRGGATLRRVGDGPGDGPD